jgi:hypothetical protein
MAKRTKPTQTPAELARAVIAELGGTAATARIFGIKQPSVSAWLKDGIPPARLMYLEVAYPAVMRKARKASNGDVIDRGAASDDVQPRDGALDHEQDPKGGRGGSGKKG